MQLHFLYGTETGTAEFLCEDMAEAAGNDWTTEVSGLETIKPADLDGDTFYVLVTSTYGTGDVPTTAVDFFEALENDQPDLGHVKFAIFGLGDETFGETYNQGSERLMNAMIACKASVVGERGLFNAAAADMPEDIGVPWLEGILAGMQEKAAA